MQQVYKTGQQTLTQAVEDNDNGLVTTNEYPGVFYITPGLTSDNFGNNIVVPRSHMMLRTIALSDQVLSMVCNSRNKKRWYY